MKPSQPLVLTHQHYLTTSQAVHQHFSTTQELIRGRTSSFFSSTDLTSFSLELDFLSPNLPEGIRLDAVNGEPKFDDDDADGRPFVIPAGKPFRGVGLGTGGGGIDVFAESVEVFGEGGGGTDVLGEGGGGMDVSTETDLV